MTTLVLDEPQSSTVGKTDFSRFIDLHRERVVNAIGSFPSGLQDLLSGQFDVDPNEALKELEDYLLIAHEARDNLPLVEGEAIYKEAEGQRDPNIFFDHPNFQGKLVQTIPHYFRSMESAYMSGAWQIANLNIDSDARSLIGERTSLRSNILDDIAAQASDGKKVIDISHYDMFSFPRQIKNYCIEILHPDYQIHQQTNAMMAALVEQSFMKPNEKNVDGIFLASGTGLNELEFLARLMKQHRGIYPEDVGVSFYERCGAADLGKIMSKAAAIQNVTINKQELSPDFLATSLGAHLKESNTSYVTLMNFLLNLPSELQDEYVRALSSVVANHKGDARLILDVPLITGDKSLQTNYDGPKDSAFNLYTARELLLIPSEYYERKVWKDPDDEGNLHISIGIEMTKDYALQDHFGQPITRNGTATKLEKGIRIQFTRSQRFTEERAIQLASIGDLQALDHTDLGTQETAHKLLYKSS